VPVTEEQVLAALKQVRDPELHRDLVSLGMVRDVKVDGDKVEFELVLTTPACPFNEQMRQMAYEAVASLPGVREVVLHVSAEVPRGVPERTPLPSVRNIIAVGSGKGVWGRGWACWTLTSTVRMCPACWACARRPITIALPTKSFPLKRGASR